MKLTNIPNGKSAKIVGVHGNSQIAKRLMEMGVVPGVTVRMVKSAPFGDPLEINLRGYYLAVRRNEADQIEVQSLNSEAAI